MMEMFVEQERVFAVLDRGLKERKALQDVAKEIIGIPTAKAVPERTGTIMQSRGVAGMTWCSECRVIVYNESAYCWKCGCRFTGKGVG